MSRGVKLSWQPAASAGVVKYRVSRTEAAQPEAFAAIAEVAAPEYTDGGTAASSLKDSTPYLYRISAINRVSSMGRPCAPVSATTLPPPDAPKKLTAGAGEVRCVPLAWLASPEPDVVRYDVFRASSAKGPFEKIGSVADRATPKFLDGKTDPGNLEDEGEYFYRIRAINAVTAESADSEIATAITREVPPRIENVAAQIRQPREVPLSWKASPDEKVLGYEIWRAEGEGDYSPVGRVGGRLTKTFVDRGGFKQFPDVSQLKDDTSYNFKIIAFNTAYSRSSASVPVSSRTKPSPAAPVQFAATTNLPRAINLSWAANTETDIVAYAIEASPDGGSFRPLATVPQAHIEKVVRVREDGLADGQARTYRVRALDKDRLISPWAENIAGRAKPVPEAPAGLKQENTPAGVRISWDTPAQPDIKSFKLYSKSVFGSEAYAVAENPEFTVEWPNLKSQLKITITAIDAANLEGPRSETIAIFPRAAP